MRARLPVVMLTMVAGALMTAAANAGDVNVGVHIGVPPPPPIVMPAPPAIVVVPDTKVYYVPSSSYNVFVYGGRYYSFHEGAWFFATTHKGPWAFIATEKVPRPVIAVPVKYYKVPPGHAKKTGSSPAAAEGCPPGQAKKGRC